MCVQPVVRGVCVHLKRSTRRRRARGTDNVASSHHCAQEVRLPSQEAAPYPGLLFVVFQGWEEQRQLVGATADAQRQAIFPLEGRIEVLSWRADKRERQSGAPARVSWGGKGTAAMQARPTQTLAWTIHGLTVSVPFLSAAQRVHTNAHHHFVHFPPKHKLPNPASIWRTSSWTVSPETEVTFAQVFPGVGWLPCLASQQTLGGRFFFW